jgi:hypothetical protein
MSTEVPGPSVLGSLSGGPKMKEGRLHEGEIFWRDHQPWLKECGYLLRPRYQPDWVASWKKDKDKFWGDCEDAKTWNVREVLSRHLRKTPIGD